MQGGSLGQVDDVAARIQFDNRRLKLLRLWGLMGLRLRLLLLMMMTVGLLHHQPPSFTEFLRETVAQLGHNFRARAVDALLNFEGMCSRSAMLVEVALGFESNGTWSTRVWPFIGVGSYVLV